MPTKIQNHVSIKLFQYVNQARIDGHFNDVVIKAGNECFPANKLVLSCFSSVFEKMFLVEMKERYEETIEIKDFDGKAITNVLEYIYTGNITIASENVMKLLSAANYLQLQEVVDACFDFLKDSISIENWSKTFFALQLYQNDSLMRQIHDFVGTNLKQVIQTDDFKKLKSTDLHFIMKNLDRTKVIELEVYEAVMSWILHDEDNRKSELYEMFVLVNLEKLPIEFLEDVVACDQLISSNLDCLKATTVTISQQFKQMRFQANGTKLLRVGGIDENENCTKVEEVYSLSIKNYPNLPYYVIGCSVLKIQDYIYCIGGNIDETDRKFAPTNKVIRMNVKAKQSKWEDAPPMTEPRYMFGAAEFHNCLVVAGGVHANETVLDSVECFDPVSNRWQQIPKLNRQGCSHQLVACDNCLYALGGMSNNWKDDNFFVEKLNSLDGKWENVVPMNKPRCYFAAVNCNGVMFVIGGVFKDTGKKSILNSVEKFSPLENKWTFVADMKHARQYHAACVLDGKIFVVGGRDENNYVRTIECYDPGQDLWNIVGEIQSGVEALSLVAV